MSSALAEKHRLNDPRPSWRLNRCAKRLGEAGIDEEPPRACQPPDPVLLACGGNLSGQLVGPIFEINEPGALRPFEWLEAKDRLPARKRESEPRAQGRLADTTGRDDGRHFASQ